MKKWILRILGGILALILAVFVVAAALPVATDPFILPEDSGAGSSTILPSFTGLQREFPTIITPLDNPTTAAKVELGRLLFYDPILSTDNDLSCAHCHHPDAGFADGQVTALGAGGRGAGPERTGGVTLARNTPSLWNVAYVPALFWDGRADTLEDQTNNPLTHVDEMGANPAEITAELQALDSYQQLFSQAFAGSGAAAVTFENTQRALASFQRTLVTNTSPFDRYAAGQIEALTAQQRRGLNLFRSGATRCFECHAAPTFASETFRVVGVPSDDPGRGAITSSVPDGSFRVPTLRNVALSAPYMHNGSIATLEAVVEFYVNGGGRAFGNEEIDPFVRGFELTEQEKADLVAFLYALTDERQIPPVPREVPSGLPVVQRQNSPGRDSAAENNSIIGTGGQIADRPAQTFTVQPGESIQAAVDQARSGDMVLIEYGIYHETVVVDLNSITIEGIPNEDGDWPVLDGQDVLSDGIISSGSSFAVGKLHIRDYSDNGILVEGVTGVHIYDIFSENTGTYGLYPVQSTNVLIERTEVVGNHDAGIYAGQCENVVVRESVVHGNVIGIEIENTLTAAVYDNLAYDNTTGILVVLLPNLTSQVSRDTKLYNNVVQDNNVDNFGRAGNTVSLLPPGIGILILSSDNAEAYNNRVSGNKTSGIAIFNLESTGMFAELDIDPTPEFNFLHDNIYENNGYDPDQFVKDLGIPVGDILWDGTGFGNTFNEPGADGAFPPVLPGNGWPDAFQRVYHRALTFLLGLVA